MSAVPAGHPPLRGLELVLATFALGLGSFMSFLDLSIANVSVPQIAGNLAVSPTQGTWVITTYAMAEAISLPLTGWLGMRFGLVRVFGTSTVIFTIASVMCSTAPTFAFLIFARAVQGMAGASMVPLAQALLIGCYPPHKRGFALGMWTITAITAPIVAPVIGGWITENYSWRWVFLVNVPFGLVVISIVATILRPRETPTRRVPVDYVGLALLTLGVACLQLLLDQGNHLDWFESPIIIALACVSAVSAIVFVIWELTDEHPIVDLRLFKRRNFTIGSLCIFLGMISFFGTLVTLPLWMQTYYGYTSLWAGMAVATGGIFAVILGPLVGANLHRIDARLVVTVGVLGFAAAVIGSGRFTPDVDFWTVAQTRLWIGIGISFFFLPLTAISMSGLSGEQFAAASGLSNFIRIIGSSLGTAVLVGAWDRHGIGQHALMAEQVNPYSPAARDYLLQLQERGLDPTASLARIDSMINVQGYLMATNWTLWTSGLLMLVLLGLIWWAKPPFVTR
ncbi:MAG: DHA2 family efflux MFS transporter permease subunit [Quisquiliibacterium sp.]